jgi:PEGA domain
MRDSTGRRVAVCLVGSLSIMSLNRRPASGLTATVLVAMLALLPGMASAGQRRGPSGGGKGGSQGGHTPSGGGERVGTATPRSGGGDGGTRTGGSTGSEAPQPAPTRARASGDSDDRDRDSGGDTAHSRPRNGAPIVGRAEPREGGKHGSGGHTTIVVPGGWYYPWGYGGYGFAGYYGGYDPWFYDEPYYDPPTDEGALRLKVKPREASVFVDGYFAGQVDEFDGMFQRLNLDSGPHRVEITLEGHETLSFEIRVVPDRTITYEGELRRLPED